MLAVTIFLFLCHAQYPLHIIFCCKQFHHFCPCLLVLWIPFLVLCLQCGILLFQRLHGRKFLQAERIEIPSGLTNKKIEEKNLPIEGKVR